ncbi:MAG: thioredoxin domain-containing protein [Microbacterium sp.]
MARAQGSKTNWFAIWITAAVVVVLVVLGGTVVWLNSQSNSSGPAPAGELINSDTGALTFGEGKDTVAVYIDFMCPICNKFEQQYGSQMQKAAEDGKITLEYHPIAILDYASQGTDYSSRSGAAMFSVAEKDPNKALDFMAALFANQPQENGPGLTDEQLIEIAKQTGVNDAAIASIKEGTFLKFPAAQAKQHEIAGTPTIEINGKRLDLQKGELDQLVKLIG